MYENSRRSINCPKCGSPFTEKGVLYYHCKDCGWDSGKDNCVDICYSDSLTAPLSNLFPHCFAFSTDESQKIVYCASMESFLQSLKIENPELQIQFAEEYTGYMAYKARLALPDWRIKQELYFNGKSYDRHSQEYQDLITRAYDCLFESNDIFREIVLPRFKDYTLIHSIGETNSNETILTASEYLYQLRRLMDKL